MKMDAIDITILEDGTIRTENGPISGINHGNAETFLKFIAGLMGGPVEITKRKGAHGHHHHQGEEHSHAGGGHDHHHD